MTQTRITTTLNLDEAIRGTERVIAQIRSAMNVAIRDRDCADAKIVKLQAERDARTKLLEAMQGLKSLPAGENESWVIVGAVECPQM